MYEAIPKVPLEEHIEKDMVRQCAWCLRLIDTEGGRISARPVPKVYEATHGMCLTCGEGWMEQFAEAQGVQVNELWQEIPFSLIAQKQPFGTMLTERGKPITIH